MLLGGTTSPTLAALVNGTMAHCLDYDDTHLGSHAHLSGPTWAATLALADEAELSGLEALRAFIVGFEVGGKLGGGELGAALTERGFHATGVIGKLAATAAACAALGHEAPRAAHAMGLAATQGGGLTGSFGTMAKPFHAGKAAMDGVLAARLSAQGFEAATDLLDAENGLAPTMVQDGSTRGGPAVFQAGEELLHNTFKPYASCLLTHPAIDAARRLADQVRGRNVEKLKLAIHPLAPCVAGKPDPRTPLEGKFSLAYCVAIALRGHRATATDFSEERLEDPAVRSLLPTLEVVEDAGMDKRAAALEVCLADGERLSAEVPVALGNPENPMGWPDMEEKFTALVEPVLQERAGELLRVLRAVEQPGRLAEALNILAGG
jgi:2-methylcitrate dehydratase PrpD